MINSTHFVSNSSSGFVMMTFVFFCGCSILKPVDVAPPNQYTFDGANSTLSVQTTSIEKMKNNAPTVMVGIPRAAPGFDSNQMAYVRHSHQTEYFRQSEWIAAPATMLSPIIAAVLERSGQFKAVVRAPSSIISQLRLDVEIVRLQQEFFNVPSQVHFTLRVHLIDASTRQVIAWREFDSFVATASEDPYGGVIATNTVIRNVTKELADFCVSAVNSEKK